MEGTDPQPALYCVLRPISPWHTLRMCLTTSYRNMREFYATWAFCQEGKDLCNWKAQLSGRIQLLWRTSKKKLALDGGKLRSAARRAWAGKVKPCRDG